MPIFRHKNYPILGHSRDTSWKFVCLFVQISDYFFFFCFIFYAYIMFIYCHTVNGKQKKNKKNSKKTILKKIKKIQEKK